jgi:DMSO/TMAO reductase YedYZ molybdopterin-dependent catalytic subunit
MEAMRNAIRPSLILLAAILFPTLASGEGLGPDASGKLPPVAQPPWPLVIPGYTELDPETGLHMTGTPTRVDLAAYRLQVTGKVNNPLSLSFDDLRRLPRLSSRPTIVCQGYFEDVATWAGASFAALLDRAGVQGSAREIEMVCADGYTQSITLAQARSPDAYLAYELEGKLIPVLHGFPLRAILPSLTGYNWAKWIVAIRVL